MTIAVIVEDVANMIDTQRNRSGMAILSTRKGDLLRIRRLLKERNAKEVVSIRKTTLQVSAMSKVHANNIVLMIVAQEIFLTTVASKKTC